MNYYPALTIAALLLGYSIARLVPSEMRNGKQYIVIGAILIAVPYMFMLVPWKGALVLSAALLGGFFAVLAVAAVGLTSTSTMLLGLVLGIFAGSRWQVEQRPWPWLLIASALALGVTLIPQLL